MSLNLIADAWIPVRTLSGGRRTIAPWEMADPEVARPDWPRADLDLGCHELLIGLVHLADPPEDAEEWEDRRSPDPDRLRDRLAPLAPAFELLGDGPRFMQEAGLDGEPGPLDMLFIDSAGASTAENNADLMVRRDRYGAADPALVAMALHTFQNHAPSGGAGNRTSMRGGGPLVTLIDPGRGPAGDPSRSLWNRVWANAPCGAPQGADGLPWMRPPRLSKAEGSETTPEQGHPAEAFFGMPRRLRLTTNDAGRITGVVQKPRGTNYAGWVHPLSPYYRMKAGAELLPRHPRAGRFGYRQWQGVTIPSRDGDLARRARCVDDWEGRVRGEPARVLVAGWSMDKMKPRDFLWSEEPHLSLTEEAAERLRGLVAAADKARAVLRAALTPVTAEGEAREAVLEDLYARTEAAFLDHARALSGAAPDVEAIAQSWLSALRDAAGKLFDDRALPGLDAAADARTRAVVEARRNLLAAFAGRTKTGREMFGALRLDAPKARRKKEATA
jgi:CRISPR system Cascade subunit CasA